MKSLDRAIIIIFSLWLVVCAITIILYFRGQKEKHVETDPMECQNLKVWYDGFNEKYFFGNLPKDAVVEYGTPMKDGKEVLALTTIINGKFHIIFF